MRLQMIFSLQKKEGPKPFFSPSGFCRSRPTLYSASFRVIVHRVRAPSHHVDDDGGHVNLCRLWASATKVTAVRVRPSSVTTSIALNTLVELPSKVPVAYMPGVAITLASGRNVIQYGAGLAPRFETTIR